MLDSESLNKFENKFEPAQTLSDEFFQPAAITDPGCERELMKTDMLLLNQHQA